MKVMMSIVLMVLFHHCTSTGSERDELSGIYIRHATHEFGTEMDTIKISVQNANARIYDIARHWRYDRLLDGIYMETDYKREVTTGRYDAKHKVLTVQNSGLTYAVDPLSGVLFNGPVKYRKQ